jgi:hypothetical protein
VTAGFLFAMTLPGLLLLLVALTAIEKITSKLRRKSLLTGAHRPSLGATGLDLFSAAINPGKATELEERRQAKTLRLEHRSRDHNGIDLQAGTASFSSRGSRAESASDVEREDELPT